MNQTNTPKKDKWGWYYKATVDRVVDGDTVDLIVDYGFNLKQKQRIRLLNVDTPERGFPNFQLATMTLKRLLDQASCQNPDHCVRLRSYKTGKYGRWLGHITSMDGTIDVNKELAEVWPDQ